MEEFLENTVGFIWNWPVALLCLAGCIFFSWRLKFVQLWGFPHAIELIRGKYDNPNEKGQITHFQALSAALSATIGLGNIAGVAIAIAVGGPGAVFWMWVIGFFGMATKYTECALGTHYREIEKRTGIVHGGPMYYIKKGLGEHFAVLSIFYAGAISLASFGAASLFQSNQAAAALFEYYHVPKLMTGVALLVLCSCVIIGGIKRIGNVASKIVPFMCVIYIIGAVLICMLNIHHIPAVIKLIVMDAFTGQAAAGGFVPVLLTGIRRAIFSNEAGLGSAAIAHAAVKTDYPIREGIVASLGPFIDTIVVCSATAFVIILSGNFGTHMYQNSSNFIVSFEHPSYANRFQDQWQIKRKENSPKETEHFRLHITGKNILHYAGNKHTHKPATFLNIENKTEKIRLSYFKKKGDMIINIYDKDQVLLGTVDSADKIENNIFDITNFNQSGKWESAIISFKNQTDKTVGIQFIPKGETVDFYIDSIEPVKKLSGIALTTTSFDEFFKGFGSIFITISVLFFAFSTMITWSYYGETAMYYLFGKKIILLYKLVFVCLIVVGATESLGAVINFSDAMVGLLVIPNILSLFLLSGKVSTWTKDYFRQLKAGEIKAFK